MDDQLLEYYERELTFIREMGAQFAKKYPKIAGRLLLEPDKCEDPHTERLIEAFALLSGRIHKKIDDDFPEITESLMNIIYPHYINPVPSMSIVRFDPMGKNIPETGYVIPKGTALFSKPINGTPCRFTTTQKVQLMPVEVVSAQLDTPRTLTSGAVQAIRLDLKTFNNLSFTKIRWDHLRFYLNGPHQHVFHLYEMLFNNVCHIEFELNGKKSGDKTVALPPDMIRPVGFEPKEGMLPFSKRSFPGYLLLFEYFCFPEKFLFFDLMGMDKLAGIPSGDTATLWIYLNRSTKADLLVNRETLCLNTAPVVNLFKKIAEPIRISHRKTQYRVIADMRRQNATEIYSVNSVTASTHASMGDQVDYKPFYSLRHHLGEMGAGEGQVFWHIKRNASNKKDDSGTEVYLSFSDLNLQPAHPGNDILTISATCTNRGLPSRLPFGDPGGDFNMETAAPVSKIISLIKPTSTRRPFLDGALQWRLISHLSLNYMSLVEGGETALKEILTLYDFDHSLSSKQQINGIVSLDTRHVTKRIGASFVRGIRISLTLDEDKYVGTGLYLFASVLERFMAQYVSVNSFSQFAARTLQREEPLKIWPPRSGNQILL